jgi:hypothetical protein
MRGSSILTEDQRRHLAHIYAALRVCIHDELEYDHPGFAPLDAEAFEKMGDTIYTQLTELMYAAHAHEATTIEVQLAEARERLEEERLAATWRLEVGHANAAWLNNLSTEASDEVL